jgi:moderate conductance mechanosensitive channel
LHYEGLSDWLRNGLLPTALIVLGAALIARFGQWVSSRYRDDLDVQAREHVERGEVIPEALKRSRAIAQAAAWAFVSLTYFVAGLLAIRQIGVPLTTLIAPATVIGVAVGFGAQQLVGDLLAGFFLFSEHQFGIGDLIRLSTPGTTTGITGTVEELTLRVTKVRTGAGEVVVVPNSALRQVTNLSKDWSRVVLDIPVPLDEDLEEAIAVLRKAADEMKHDEHWADVLIGDSIVAGVESIEVGYVSLRLVVRTLPGRQFDASRELRLRCARALRQAGISAPPIESTNGTR